MFTASVMKMKILHPVQVSCRRVKMQSYYINACFLTKEVGS